MKPPAVPSVPSSLLLRVLGSLALCFILFHIFGRTTWIWLQPYDGQFQAFTPLRRMAEGQFPGRDFPYFHGMGMPLLHYPWFRLLGSSFQASVFVGYAITAGRSWGIGYHLARLLGVRSLGAVGRLWPGQQRLTRVSLSKQGALNAFSDGEPLALSSPQILEFPVVVAGSGQVQIGLVADGPLGSLPVVVLESSAVEVTGLPRATMEYLARIRE